jgi:tetratricopeptide (TPR) repeat protein
MNISCDTEAQSAFTRGLLQLHSFAWQQARASFEEAADNDPDCAIAYWGVAMSYYDSLHEHPPAEEVEAAIGALAMAKKAGTRPARETAYLNAAAELFRGYPDVERVERDRNYSRAMQAIADAYPDDDEARIFYALSLLALARRGEQQGLLMQAAELLEPLFAELPEHPGVAHYLIHAYDDAGDREPGISAAQRYAGIAPLMTHAQHMPSHIFAGLGMWAESNASNANALEANPRYYHSLMYLCSSASGRRPGDSSPSSKPSPTRHRVIARSCVACT